LRGLLSWLDRGIVLPGPDSPPPGAMILVVERDPHVQALERYFLEQAGHSVELVDNGRAAIARARELQPCILISEILVAGVDGLAVCRAIKAARRRGTSPCSFSASSRPRRAPGRPGRMPSCASPWTTPA